MPQLNKFDDFDACMQVFDDKARFCYVRTAIKPDPSSELYNFIWEFSKKKKQHFRHDKLTRGICINTCTQSLDKLGPLADEFYVEKFKLDYAVTKI
jgi:hypothetical protein